MLFPSWWLFGPVMVIVMVIVMVVVMVIAKEAEKPNICAFMSVSHEIDITNL